MVTIKNSLDGLEFWLDRTQPYSELKKALLEKLDANRHFYFSSAQRIIFFGKCLSERQKRDMKNLLNEEYHITDIHFADEEAEQQPETVEESESVEQMQEPSVTDQQGSLFLPRTIRSGQRISCTGDIVVIGDVNAGAELIADGSIAVFGKLRGLAHAGASGNMDACIVANYLMPKQIRIGSRIAIIPPDREIEGPEMVQVQQGKIVVTTVG